MATNIKPSTISTFYNSLSTKEQIQQSGEQIFFILLGLPLTDETLDYSRLRVFNSKVIQKKGSEGIDNTTLPPTTAAAFQHSCRVFHQVQTWNEVNLPATDWGWKLVGDEYVPVTTVLSPASQDILSIIHCNCKGNCSNRQYSCKQ